MAYVVEVQQFTTDFMHLSAAIPGGGPRGTPGHLHQDIYKFHLPRASILPQKATTVPPPPRGA